jgi:hypothetical protein
MSEPRNDAPGYSAIQAFLDRAAIAAYDDRIPSELEPPKTLSADSRIVVAGRGRRDKVRAGLPA